MLWYTCIWQTPGSHYERGRGGQLIHLYSKTKTSLTIWHCECFFYWKIQDMWSEIQFLSSALRTQNTILMQYGKAGSSVVLKLLWTRSLWSFYCVWDPGWELSMGYPGVVQHSRAWLGLWFADVPVGRSALYDAPICSETDIITHSYPYKVWCDLLSI